MGYIYKITNPINQKVYIGKTRFTIEDRWKQHCYIAEKQLAIKYPLYLAMRKYDGINTFTIEQIENVDEELLNERECYWISYYDSYIENKRGYNATLGGEGNTTIDYEEVFILWYKGYSISEIVKEMNFSHNRSSIRKILKNYKNYSIEESNKRGDQIQSKNRFKKIYQYSLNGKLLNIFANMYKAEENTGISSKAIWGAVNHKQKTSGGFQWRFEDDIQNIPNLEKTSRKSYHVIQLDKNQKYIATYINASEASKKTGISDICIRNVCQGKSKTAGGYIWKYEK